MLATGLVKEEGGAERILRAESRSTASAMIRMLVEDKARRTWR